MLARYYPLFSWKCPFGVLRKTPARGFASDLEKKNYLNKCGNSRASKDITTSELNLVMKILKKTARPRACSCMSPEGRN